MKRSAYFIMVMVVVAVVFPCISLVPDAGR